MTNETTIIPFCDMFPEMFHITLKYATIGNDHKCEYLQIVCRLHSSGKVPLTTDIDVVTSIGLNDLSLNTVEVTKNTTILIR